MGLAGNDYYPSFFPFYFVRLMTRISLVGNWFCFDCDDLVWFAYCQKPGVYILIFAL